MGRKSLSSRDPIPIAEVPDGVVLYDGVCVLCSRWFRFVAARDDAARFRFTAVQDTYGRWLALRLGLDPDNPRANVLVMGGRAYLGADAAIQILRHLRGWSVAAGLLGLVPPTLLSWLYDRLARNRYRLFGRTETCMVPDPGLARHILRDTPPHG